MKKILAIFLIILSNLSCLKCADNYEMGDILYVWAKNGLNVRTAVGTEHTILEKIPFGESVVILGKTKREYNVMGIDTTSIYRLPYFNVEPIIFKGNWVHIQTLSGKSGYVIDQYLLRYKVQAIDGNFASELNIKITSTEILFRKNILPNGEAMNSKTKTEYEGGIIGLTELDKYSFWSEFSFLNATIEEVLILLSSSLDNFSYAEPSKNWKEEVAFSTSACSYNIKREGKIIILSYGCSC